MKINRFFRKEIEVYISIDTEGAERRDAEPFIAFDTDVTYVEPLWDEKREEIEIIEDDEPVQILMLPAPKPQKLLTAGKQPLLLAMPGDSEATIEEIFEAQHVVYFSDMEFKDGVEIITEAKVERWKQRNFAGAKIAALLLMIVGLASILFPSVSLKAAKVEYTVNPTNTTPGLSFAISSDDLAVKDNQGSLPVRTQMNQLVTSTLGLDVSTTGADGYKMYVTTSGKDKKGDYTSALVNKEIDVNNGEGAKINTLSGDVPMMAFPAGYWGYAVDPGLQNTTIFKPFPSYDATDTVKYGGDEIASANTAIADEDVAGETPFTIGVKTDSSIPSGKYENELLFTVIANPVTVTYNLSFNGNTTDDSLANVPATVTETSSEVFKNVKVPAGKPTRDDFVFVGWADEENGSVAYEPGDDVMLQVTNINDSQTVNKTLYAVWENKEYLQDFNEENDLINIGDSKTLYDKRDDEFYTVKRLADGKVWMTQNLNYATGATYVSSDKSHGSYYTWDVAQSVCPVGWHLPTTGSTGEFVDLYEAYNSAEVLLGTDGPHFAQAGIYHASALQSDGTDGRYWSANKLDSATGYNFRISGGAVQTAGTDTMSDNALSVRCVAGDEQRKYLQDFNDAIDLRTVGDSDTYYDKRDGEDYIVKRLDDGKVWMVQNLRYAEGAHYVSENKEYGGYYDWETSQSVCPVGWHQPTAVDFQNIVKSAGGSGSTSSEYNTTVFARLTATSGSNPGYVMAGLLNYPYNGVTQAGDVGGWWTPDAMPNNSDRAYLFFLVGTQNRIDAYHANNSPKTQSMSVRCIADQPNVYFIQDFDENTMLPNVGDWAELTDRRDQETYKVKRMADGKVWMTQNLRIGDESESTTLTTEDSAINSSDWTLPAQTSTAFSSPNYNVANYRLNATYGGYYNWYTATAGTGTQAMTSGNAVGSICPKGWHLPTGGDGGESAQLYDAYGNNASSLATAFSPEYAGWNNVNNQGGDVYYMTSTVADGDNPYVLYMTASGTVNPNNSLRVYKYYGFSIRCVADADAKVSFNANGGTGTMEPQRFTKGIRQNISANTFTRAGHSFVGWALTPDATTARYTDGQSVVFNKPTTLYAVWTVDYMQDFNAKARLQNAGDTVTLMDSRDKSIYTVRRLEDGKVWMTQNLRYTGTTDPGTTTRYSGSFTVNAADSQGAGTITLTNNFGSNSSSSAFAAYRGDVDDGAYYGWTAATKVCPKGWHLMTNNEIVNLNGVYGGTSGAVTNSPSYDDLTSSSKANITLSGRYSGASFDYDNAKGRYWAATEVPGSNGSKAYALSINKDLNNMVEPNNPDGWKYYGFPVRCVANESETVSFDANGGTGTMADVTVEKGENVTLTNAFTRPAYNFAGWSISATGAVVYTNEQIITPENDMTLYAVWEEKGEILQNFNQDIDLLTVGSTQTLYDERDGETYTVKRLPDGKVWMTQNLRYATGAFKVSNETEYGAYYVWDTAKTVCPRGWHLPTGGDNGEFAKLDIAYGGSGLRREDPGMAANYHLNTGNWPNMALNGKYVSGGSTLQYVGVDSYLWSQDRKDSSYVWAFSAGDGSNEKRVIPNDYTSAYAIGVRCIADYEEKTISFNANGGTGTMANVTVVKGQSIVLPDNTFVKDGYEFLGWSTSQNAGSVMYNGGEIVLVMGDMELFAVWQAYMQTANCASLPAGATSTLIDKRDGQAYNVYRFENTGVAGQDYPADLSGACIMTDDLALGYTTGGSVVKGEDLVLDTTNSAGAGTIKSGASSWSNTNSDDNFQYVNGEDGAYDSHSYYSWPAAQIACPKGWSLPTRQQYKNMMDFIGVGRAGSTAFRSEPYNFLYGGRYSGSWSDKGTNARYWTGTEYNTIHSFYVAIASGAVNADTHEGKQMGQSVRCMLMP